MGRFLAILIMVLFTTCTTKISKENIGLLQGYWEIKKVTLSDGVIKEYKANTTIDYIEISGSKGFRKKLNPKLDGSYVTTDDAALFTLKEREKIFIMHYKNDLSEWEEQILTLSQDSFSVLNQEGTTYFYERYEPINTSR
ncbi:MAG: lipocalin family protein [Bacteroidota bacterium]